MRGEGRTSIRRSRQTRGRSVRIHVQPSRAATHISLSALTVQTPKFLPSRRHIWRKASPSGVRSSGKATEKPETWLAK